MPKNVKGGPFVIFDNHCVAKYRKKGRGPFGVIQKKFKKSRIVPKNSGAKMGSLVCFRGSGRVLYVSFRFGRASEVRVF